VYLAVDYLSKTGKVAVTLDPDRTYTVKVYSSAGEESQLSFRQDHAHSTA
jgi:uncharacterized protein YxeA